jgi:hypothetical protein
MMRGLFFLLYFVTNCDAVRDLMRFDWNFALFNAGLLCVVGSGQALRNVANPPKRRRNGRASAM